MADVLSAGTGKGGLGRAAARRRGRSPGGSTVTRLRARNGTRTGTAGSWRCAASPDPSKWRQPQGLSKRKRIADRQRVTTGSSWRDTSFAAAHRMPNRPAERSTMRNAMRSVVVALFIASWPSTQAFWAKLGPPIGLHPATPPVSMSHGGTCPMPRGVPVRARAGYCWGAKATTPPMTAAPRDRPFRGSPRPI